MHIICDRETSRVRRSVTKGSSCPVTGKMGCIASASGPLETHAVRVHRILFHEAPRKQMVWKILKLGITKFQLYVMTEVFQGYTSFKRIYRGECAMFEDYSFYTYGYIQFYNLVFFSMKQVIAGTMKWKLALLQIIHIKVMSPGGCSPDSL